MSKSILIVDDAATMRRMVAFTLKNVGYQLLEAGDGAQALDMLRNKSVDLVITDVNMPNMDGIELTRRLRTLPNFVRTPILLLTTESAPEKKVAGRAAGATGWIVKPFQQDQLLSVVSRVLPA